MSKHTAGPWRFWTQRRPGKEDTCTFQNLDGVEVLRAVTVTITEADAWLIATAPDLLAALQKVMALNAPFTGNPSHAELIEFWQDEKEQGRGAADDMLAALAAIAKATWTTS